MAASQFEPVTTEGKAKETERSPSPATNIFVDFIPYHCNETMCRQTFIDMVRNELMNNGKDEHATDNINDEKEAENVIIESSQIWEIQTNYHLWKRGNFSFSSPKHAEIAVKILNNFDLTNVWKIPKNADCSSWEVRPLHVVIQKEKQEKSKTTTTNNIDSNSNKNNCNSNTNASTLTFCQKLERNIIKPKSNLYVKHLSIDIDDSKLYQMFSKFGEIVSCKVMIRENGVSKQFGFVAFKDPNDARKAQREMNSKQQDNGMRPLYVSFAQKKRERKQQIQRQQQLQAQAQNNLRNDELRQKIGDEIYKVVSQRYPFAAPKITGMILGKGFQFAQLCLADLKFLNQMIDEAVEVLEKSLFSQNINTQEMKQEGQCVVCRDRKSCMVYVPCGHMVLCNPCAQTLASNAGNPTCVLCRTPFEKIMRVFPS